VSQSFNTPGCREDSGSTWHHMHLLDQESAERTMTSQESSLGFRLARDGGGGMKPVRGSKFYSVYGIGVFTQGYPEYYSAHQLGFRLVHDWVNP